MANRRTTDGSRGGVFGRDTSVSLEHLEGPRGATGATGPAGNGITGVNATLANNMVTLTFTLSDGETTTAMYNIAGMTGGDGRGIQSVTPTRSGTVTTVVGTIH